MAPSAQAPPALSLASPTLRFDRFVALLRCPDCGAPLAFTVAPTPASGRAPFGVLRCPCAAYPVLDGVPVLRRGTVAVRSIADARVVGEGPTVDALVGLVEAGCGEAALVRLLAFPPSPWPLNLTAAGRALSRAPIVGAAGLALRRRLLRRWLGRRDRRTAEDWFSLFYWRSPTLYDPFSYFFFRFAQPRHLATLALTPALATPTSRLAAERPLLDLACGYGHLLHSLTGADDEAVGREAVGVDQNFHQAWVGRHWVAPGAQFACADADRRLPFANGTFDAAVCADAFHYLGDHAGCAAELKRVAEGGTVVLARVGNATVAPPEGDELTPAAYRALLAPWATRSLGEDALVDAYLAGTSPDLRAPTDDAPLDAVKWLYLVASEGAFPAAVPLGAPHTVGAPALNPLYAGDGAPFRFPSPWYAFENARMAAYHAERAALGADACADLSRQRWTPRLERLAERFVMIGLPARYARRRGRPWPVAAHRALTTAVARLRPPSR